MKKLTILPLLLFLLQCTSTANVKLLPTNEVSGIETIWKNKTVGKGSDFSIKVSSFLFEDRNLFFLKDGKPIGKGELKITPSVPLLLLGWIPLGIPYLWLATVSEQQTFDLTVDLKRAAESP
ncbi:MAG TPA: hypothetical protein PK079_12655 [Leptospiraceae bacterium]|nr:hypothetical protein [Leptospiraceae bacterium]HMW06925.1 hypothetical protein [Leptospiraceae bacterium]HMX32287.1 hypothetical protein [Leptospiraceae bacterium]HMY33455.1 hypothetical protein [Leptospiraceae bacterium]HMZ65489.1 hypothetical protein [Leptospiraceae bacterium]